MSIDRITPDASSVNMPRPRGGVRLSDDDVELLAVNGLIRRQLPAARRDLDNPRPDRWGRALVATQVLVYRHATSLMVMLPLLALAAALHGVNMLHSPGPNDDEATYVSQAWAVRTHGELSHYTYWYDHPPLGWLLLVVWNQVVMLLPGHGDLWAAGRHAMLAVHLTSCVLLFVLVRRLRLPRWAGAVAVLLFTISPLGMEWQRLTLLDNIGTPLLLGAWVLALSPRRRLAAYAGAGLCLAAAVLVKETNALFVPAIAAQLWFASRGHNREFAVTLFVGALAGTTLLYPWYAVVKGELLPGEHHVSLLGALRWQLLDRPGSGSVTDPTSDVRLVLADWFHRDGPLLLGALALAPLAWRHRPARPLVAVTLLLAAMPLRGGYLPAPYPINLVWPAALVAAVGAHVALRPPLRAQQHWLRAVAALAAACALVPLGYRAWGHDRDYLTADNDRSYRQARAWLLANTDRDDVTLVDNTLWLDLVEADRPRRNVVWYYKLDLDTAVQRQHPGGWRAVDYVADSGLMEATKATLPITAAAIEHGTVVADFGDIRIYRVTR